MSKFVGSVNGKEYTDQYSFSKAAMDAILYNETNICISSYYSSSNGCGDTCECGNKTCVCDENYDVNKNKTIKITSDDLTPNVERAVRQGMVEKIKVADIDSVIEAGSVVIEKIEETKKNINTTSDKITELKSQLKTINYELDKLKEKKSDEYRILSYYYNLQELIKGRLASEPTDQKQKVEPEKETEKKLDNRNPYNRDVLGDVWESLTKALDELGFWK